MTLSQRAKGMPAWVYLLAFAVPAICAYGITAVVFPHNPAKPTSAQVQPAEAKQQGPAQAIKAEPAPAQLTKHDAEVLKWKRDQLQARIYRRQVMIAQWIDSYPHLYEAPVNSDLSDPHRETIQFRMRKIREDQEEIRKIETILSQASAQ